MKVLAPPVLAVALLSLAACGSDEGEATQANLGTDATFLATSVPWREGQDPIEQVVVRIENEQVHLRAGCNELSTTGASIDNGRLLSDSFIQTDMGCSGPVQDQDDWLSNLLSSEPRIVIEADRFELRSEDATLSAASSPPIPR